MLFSGQSTLYFNLKKYTLSLGFVNWTLFKNNNKVQNVLKVTFPVLCHFLSSRVGVGLHPVHITPQKGRLTIKALFNIDLYYSNI